MPVIICYSSTLHPSDMRVSLYLQVMYVSISKVVWGSKGYISYASLIFTIMQLFSEFCNNYIDLCFLTLLISYIPLTLYQIVSSGAFEVRIYGTWSKEFKVQS